MAINLASLAAWLLNKMVAHTGLRTDREHFFISQIDLKTSNALKMSTVHLKNVQHTQLVRTTHTLIKQPSYQVTTISGGKPLSFQKS